MSGLVSGYSGIIAPPNLATNGAFGIHQRGNHGFIPFKSGDYVADCWFINNPTDVDYLEVWHSVPNDGSVNKAIYRGYGKKGQQINIKCRDDSPYGEHFTMLTSQANVYPYGAEKSVPLKVDCLPKRDHSYSTVLNESKILYNSNDYVSVVGIVENTSTDGLMYGGFVRLYLQEDGEFSFIINNYTELAGAFKNPPKYAPVPYADDLARCQRYYYKSSAVRPLGRAIKVDTNVVRYSEIHQFPTTMSAIPSVTVESAGTTGDHVAYTGSGGGSSIVVLTNGSGLGGNTTTSQTRIWIEYSGLTSTQTNHAVDNGVASYYNITAEVV